MNCKTRKQAIARLAEYGGEGVVWRYVKSNRWNWATKNSGCWTDILNTICENGEARLNPDHYLQVLVDSVKFI